MEVKLDKPREKYVERVSVTCGKSMREEFNQIGTELNEINPDYKKDFMSEAREAIQVVMSKWRRSLNLKKGA